MTIYIHEKFKINLLLQDFLKIHFYEKCKINILLKYVMALYSTSIWNLYRIITISYFMTIYIKEHSWILQHRYKCWQWIFTNLFWSLWMCNSIHEVSLSLYDRNDWLNYFISLRRNWLTVLLTVWLAGWLTVWLFD